MHWLAAKRFSEGAWAAEGYGVLAPAFRGYHGSSGWPDERGLMVKPPAYAFVAAHAETAYIVIHGHSLCSSVAAAVATRFDCGLLILESPFTSLP